MSVPDALVSRGRTAPEVTAGPRHPGLILAFLCVAGFMTFLDVSIVNVALPTIERGLNISETYLQYVVTAYGILRHSGVALGKYDYLSEVGEFIRPQPG